MTVRPSAVALVRTLEETLRARGTAERAEGGKAYLKSDLDFLGVDTPTLRKAVKALLRENSDLGREAVVELVEALWRREVFELRAAAVEVLIARVGLLEPSDLELLERLLRESHTWALVDGIAPRVVGPLVARHPELEATLDRWARDDDFWLRRAALLFDLIPLGHGEGDWRRFTRYADRMLDEKEFFIRKAIGWVLRSVGKTRPRLVTEWLLGSARVPIQTPSRAPTGAQVPRAARASGVTLREAVKYLPEADREAIRRAVQGAGRGVGG